MLSIFAAEPTLVELRRMLQRAAEGSTPPFISRFGWHCGKLTYPHVEEVDGEDGETAQVHLGEFSGACVRHMPIID
jgi:hypothetical protein